MPDPTTGQNPAPQDAPPSEAAKPDTVAAAPDAAAAGSAPKLGPAFAKLAREQKAAREAAEKLKSERAAFEADRQALAEIQAKVKAFEEATANAKRQPLKYLETLGLTYQDLTEAQLNDGEPTPNLEVKAVRDELAELKRQQEQERHRAVEEQKAALAAQQAQLVTEFQKSCTDFVTANAEKYELTAKFAPAQVFAVINEHAAVQMAEGVPADQIRLLSLEEAADAVEKHFEEQLEAIRTTKKFAAKTPAQPAPATSPAPRTQGHLIRPVTNQLSSSTTGGASKPLTPAERKQAALETLRKARAQ